MNAEWILFAYGSLIEILFLRLEMSGFLARYFSHTSSFTPSPDGEGWGEENPKYWLLVWGKFLLDGLATAKLFFMSVPAPTGGILFFACPKKSIQKKGHPDAACTLCAEAFERGCLKGRPSPCMQLDASLHRPYGLIRSKAPVLGAAYGRETPSRRCSAV